MEGPSVLLVIIQNPGLIKNIDRTNIQNTSNNHNMYMLPAVNDSQNQRPQLMDIDEESDHRRLMAIHQVYSVSLGLEEELKTFN